jgi:hypothetical protein
LVAARLSFAHHSDSVSKDCFKNNDHWLISYNNIQRQDRVVMKAYKIGDGTCNGDAFTVPGNTTCPYHTGEYGTYENSNNLLVGRSVVANYTVVQRKSCYRGRCSTYFTSVLQGGKGLVTETTLH